MSITYVRSGSWKSRSRNRALNEIYSLVSLLYDNDILIVGASDEEIKIAKRKGLKFEVTQPDLEEAKRIRVTYGVEVLPYFLHEIPKEKKYKVIICLNVIDWEPIKLNEALKRIYEILDDDGYLIISFYSRIFENAPDKDFIPQTKEKKLLKGEIKKYAPKGILIARNGKLHDYEFPRKYRDENGILKTYLLTKKNLELIYERVFRNR
jgi:SAM-dependent methyltransferase